MANSISVIIFGAIFVLFLSVFTIPANATQSIVESHIHFMSYDSPRTQFLKTGLINTVSCPEGLELIMKKSNGSPACVKSSTATKLIERGWAIHVLPDYDNVNNNSELFKGSMGEHKVVGQDVIYGDYAGYLARPSNEQAYPGIIIIHEWWGLNDNIRQTAENLASHGYAILAVDLYGVPAATTADDARQLMSSYDPQKGIANMNAAVEFLEQKSGSDKIASIGWCFGGAQSLSLALNNPNMDATVIYYGRLVTDKDQLSAIEWPVLGIFAGLDQGIPVESVNEFEKSLDELGIQNEIHVYPNVDHAFANPSGQRYAPEETKDAWQKTLDFLDSNLK